MTEKQSRLKEVTFCLNRMCILPYTDDELYAIGCLGFDMAENKNFADKYMACLLEKHKLINSGKRIPFSELNLQLYRKILKQPGLKQIPNWMNVPANKNMTGNGLKTRISKMAQNIKRGRNI